MVRQSRRALMAVAVLVLAALTGVVWLFREPVPRPGASSAERLWVTNCAACHGVDGRGSWRAALFLVKPGDLTDHAQMRQVTDDYLFEIIKKGGSPLGRPGMPGYEFQLTDDEIRQLVAYVRSLAAAR